jgi:hypothetical protein
MSRRSIAILILLSSFVVGPLLARGAERSSTEGIHRYKKLVKLHPHKATYRNALGYYYLKAGNLQEAEIHFLTAIEIDNSYPTPHNNLGVVYLKQDRPEQAEKKPTVQQSPIQLGRGPFPPKTLCGRGQGLLQGPRLGQRVCEQEG